MVTFERGILDVSETESSLHAQISAKQNTALSRLLRVAFGLVFVGAAVFLYLVRDDFPQDNRWILYAICSGLLLIGILILIFSGKHRKFKFIEIDRDAKQVSYGHERDSEVFLEGRISFASIEKVHLGGGETGDMTGMTALYVFGEDGPRNGALLVGTRMELNHIETYLRQSLH